MGLSRRNQKANNEPLHLQGPPYLPKSAGLGGLPTVKVDIPIESVIIALFITVAAANMTILQLNLRRGHKFMISGLVFGFCMARITANVLRIVWACRQHNTNVAIAAGVFTNAGVLILFIVNLIFAQRVMRAHHPRFGWSTPARMAFRILYTAVGACLIMVIVAIVYSFFTLDATILKELRDVELVAVTFLATLAFLPIVITTLCLVIPRMDSVENFGRGTMRTKIILLYFTATLLTFGASWRAACVYIVRPGSSSPWFDSKAAFYCVDYTVELIVVFTYTISRFDRRFHIPDGSSAPGHYSQGGPKPKAQAIGGDEEAFNSDEVPKTADEQRADETAWDSRLQHELEMRDAPQHAS